MAEPAWKVAMRERKKKKEEEERKKQAEEEAKRASMPAWKRAVLEKKGLLPGTGTSGGTTTPAPSSATNVPKTSATTVSKTPATTSSGLANKFMFSAAVNKKEEPHPAAPASKPSTEKTTSASPTLKTKSTRVSAAKNLFEEIASSPQIPKKSPLSPVRKGLLETSDKSSVVAHTKEQFEHNEIVSDHGDVDVQKSNVQDITEVPSSPTQPNFASSPTLPSHSHPVKEVEEQKTTDPLPPTSNVSQSSDVKKPAFTAERKTTSYNTHVVVPPAENDDKIPAWKRELLARKRGKKKETTSAAPQQPTEAEPPSSPPAQSASIPPATVSATPGHGTTPPSSSTVAPTAPEPQEKKSEATVKKPEIVNASDKKDGGDPPKLLNKEGKSIRAPVLKSTGKWADIKEEDPEFKKLPMWKQELIKRRRRDMENRTAPIPKEEVKEEKKPPSLPSNITTPFDRINAQKENSQESSKKPSHNLTPIRNTPSPSTSTSTETTEQSGISKIAGKFGNVKSVKKPPPPTSPIKENGDTYTMIDEESSDEEATPPKHLKTTRSSSILKIEGKPRRKLSISWSDSNLSHYYPKYDYSDYDDIEQDPPIKEVAEEVDTPVSPSSPEPAIATPIHPWLAETKSSPSPSSVPSYSSNGLGSVGSFMSMYTLNASSFPSYSPPSKEPETKEEVQEETETSKADIYANLDSDTAALLF
ncbi:PREDICTED: titin-like [Amphimedon queenslandica]|uniref:Uncharacterized protein n=1 Tax=Amphimedon queenslandica TaxID=400682 RepID=A0A1X7VCL4_AMPQE|nr:PREDICTED: titin-like [Amphimedon queenslandica]|eukprot:XP_011402665.1 PREDICTED: titin-like [Amphimedon queenslandica]